MPVEISAALIGAVATATASAATIAQSAIQNAKSNLACAVTVFNGTNYHLSPVAKSFRKGALFGGVEGTSLVTPSNVPAQGYSTFSFEQVLGATTDVIGAVLYRSEKFDLLIGFHITDFAGIHRYLSAVLLQKDKGSDLFKTNWDAFNLDHGLNKYTWSGVGRPNKYTSTDIKYNGLPYKGVFHRGIVSRKEDGEIETEQNEIKIRYIDILGDGVQNSFSTQSVGGGQKMHVIVSDTPFSTPIIDISGTWKNRQGEEWKFTFHAEGLDVNYNDGRGSARYLRDGNDPNKYVQKESGTYFEFSQKEAFQYSKSKQILDSISR